MKKIMICLFFLLTACVTEANSMSDQEKLSMSADFQALQKQICASVDFQALQKQNCGSDEVLRKVSDYSSKLYDTYRIVAVSFYKEDAKCALTLPFSKPGLFDEWFSIEFASDCLKASSIFSVESTEHMDNSTYLNLKEYNKAKAMTAVIHAGYDVKLGSLRKAVHADFYQCQPK